MESPGSTNQALRSNHVADSKALDALHALDGMVVLLRARVT